MSDAPSLSEEQMLTEVLEGMQQPQKAIPSKYFYDKRGSQLFEQITGLEEYYPTRTETGILEHNFDDIAAQIGDRAVIVELGSGSSKKTRMLLDRLDNLAGYIPIDISEEYLMNVVNKLKTEYPDLFIKPVCADYTRPFDLPEIPEQTGQYVAFYPGSTIGNFEPGEARQFLAQIAEIVGDSGSLLIGVDLKKDREILEKAYNDSKGITAEFNKNILRRLNNEFDTDFKPDRFEHLAFYNEEEGRIEMHLKSTCTQSVEIGDTTVRIEKGETIHTENSYKYSVEGFQQLASGSFMVEEVWTDRNNFFSLQFLRVK